MRWYVLRMDTLLTREEAAEYLRVHPDTVRRWAREGRFPEHKIGGAVRYVREELRGALDLNQPVEASE